MGLVKSVIQAALVLTLVAGCAGVGVDPAHDGQLRVVTTTGILADLVRNVAGDRATVSQLVPDGPIRTPMSLHYGLLGMWPMRI